MIPSPFSNYWREILLEVIRQIIAGWCQQTLCFQKFVDNAQQCFAFTPQANFPTHNFQWRWKVMGSDHNHLLFFKLNFQLHTYYRPICTHYSRFENMGRQKIGSGLFFVTQKEKRQSGLFSLKLQKHFKSRKNIVHNLKKRVDATFNNIHIYFKFQTLKKY